MNLATIAMSLAQVSASVSDLFPAEGYFYQLAVELGVLSPLPELHYLKAVLEKHMPQRVERFTPRLSNPENSAQWLSLILKTNFWVRLWNSGNQPVVVGLNVSGSLKSVSQQLQIVDSLDFHMARRELGIAHHWFVVLPGNPPVSPAKDELLDALYRQLKKEGECGIITF